MLTPSIVTSVYIERYKCDAEVMFRPFPNSFTHSPAQSTCSLDTGDVLIRSTSILVPGPGRGPEPERGPGQSTVQIGVQKLLDCTPIKLIQKQNHGQQTVTGRSSKIPQVFLNDNELEASYCEHSPFNRLFCVVC